MMSFELGEMSGCNSRAHVGSPSFVSEESVTSAPAILKGYARKEATRH
jgi:hypothetical protein